jgi:6-phosphogluconolactonase
MTLVYIGTYTKHGTSQGMYVYRLDPSTGALSHVQTVADVADPTYMTFGPQGRMLYSVNERVEKGEVSAFSVDPSSGHLTFVNRVASHGADPAHLSVDPSGGWLLVANYTGGTIAALPLAQDGSLGEASDVVRHTGSGPHADRQQGPHPHMIVADPAGAFILVADLGVDAVLAYRLDRATGRLVAQPDAGGRLPPGAGPRHLAFSADGRFAYVLGELDSTLVAFAYDAPTGRLSQTQVVRTLPEAFAGDNTTAAVVVAASGRFVYASNRGHDSVSAFAIDSASGQLTPRGHTPTGGRTPRDINLAPSGNILLAANQDSDSVTSFFVDQQSGAVEPTGHSIDVPRPVRVLLSQRLSARRNAPLTPAPGDLSR